jgi:hypothetical protein
MPVVDTTMCRESVDFDGEDDPQRAQNWKPFKKWRMIIAIALMTFLRCAL